MLNFSEALQEIKEGKKLQRSGWNGKGMWLILTTIYSHSIEQEGHSTVYVPFITMKTADNKFVPWLASPTDILADDWIIV